jgi:hypothetical protein
MSGLTLIENSDHFNAQLNTQYTDCIAYERKAEMLERRHSFVAGNLRALSAKLEEERNSLDERGTLLAEEAEEERRKGQIMRDAGIAACVTIAFIPVTIPVILEGKKPRKGRQIRSRTHKTSRLSIPEGDIYEVDYN